VGPGEMVQAVDMRMTKSDKSYSLTHGTILQQRQAVAAVKGAAEIPLHAPPLPTGAFALCMHFTRPAPANAT
ncbi:MAG TPA: hypothetical protein PLD73_17975, partial [Candidatus Hydrogenedentes bacterium]|nr:hypothetical protein [Candidatus Hydrogenedentota bacterium]